ncbi:fumarylacetoacetate hydrolase family protein [Alkalihalobacillus sp. MEB130]|uniref:fumarylacetoacetate hydrolase family protein n=1 Tax=Alkalihalobacillus sp. MEB130 TaxID=2976704 RepID=UPI0028DD6BFD|nr:fumarylacetoacetate hydrolase family protein [Alkalihalobacillus sp. MEB130]MDT8860111.1 fumarylacetoacetate hydrolase family protein [Alkalihalobacillus sp. MEB130]
MRFVTYDVEGRKYFGLKRENVVIDLQSLSKEFEGGEIRSFMKEMKSFIEAGEEAIKYLNALVGYFDQTDDIRPRVSKQIQDIKLLAPIENPGKVVCVGNNYMDHCIEQNVEPPKQPLIFSKWPSCIIANHEEIELPEESKQVDFEAELAVVIGKKGKQISEDEALDYIFGYTIMNDVSARDVQFGDGQWVRGKSFDTFAPLGPVLVSKDEIENPQQLHIKLDVNGEVLQNSNTKHMIFSIPYIISYLSKGFTFEPGDVIATGTPHGVGVFRNPPIFLKKGDTCTIEIEKIGILQNKVKNNHCI